MDEEQDNRVLRKRKQMRVSNDEEQFKREGGTVERERERKREKGETSGRINN